MAGGLERCSIAGFEGGGGGHEMWTAMRSWKRPGSRFSTSPSGGDTALDFSETHVRLLSCKTVK